jgi:cation transport ATPase
MNTGLASVISALKLSKKTLKIIRLNMGWAFVYNLIGLPIAAAGLLTPFICSCRHGSEQRLGCYQLSAH